MMDISPFCPVVNGNTFISYQNNWINQKVLRSGIWDGIFLDNLFARINPHIPHFFDGGLLDYDINRNAIRDETPATASDMTRPAAIQILQSIRTSTGDLALIMGNGDYLDPWLAPYLNGYTFECVNELYWDAPYLTTGFSEPDWRLAFEGYLKQQTGTRSPHTNILEGCGHHQGLTPTPKDIHDERMVLGTALLSDGFAEYDLFDARSAPSWFDEYSVNAAGAAVEDRLYKGYLGNALGLAVELASPSTLVWSEDFESAALPSLLRLSDPGIAYVGHTAAEVINGAGSLVVTQPDHVHLTHVTISTDSSQLVLSPGRTYVVEFDWRILETLDDHFNVDIARGGTGSYVAPGIVTGDSGKAHFPFTLEPGAGGYQIVFRLNGGGKIAIDNIRVSDGGAGPWRRDFEHGIVIVNPLNRPYTFTAPELAGAYNKTGIKRIRGTQDPVTNNGQPVTGSFTIGPADAIILLSDPSAPVATPILQFSTASYAVGEGIGSVMITVNRIGDTSGAASVRYATSDGTAKEGRDYIAAYGVLNFAAGESSKNFIVLIIDNAYVAGSRTVNLVLTNPSGATLSTQSTAVLTINDNDSSPGTTNPIDKPRFFVQEHYYDFLGRYPDQGGWDFWTNEITSCGTNQQCIDAKRINVSAAYFLSIEFQQTGYLVERMYKTAYGDASGASTFPNAHQLAVPIVRFSEFLPDTQQIGSGVVVGASGWETVLENNKQTFATEFVQRPRFVTALPTTMTPAQFVDKLFLNAGVTPSASDRQAAINEFGSATNTSDMAARARALRRVAENPTLNSQEFNRAFVLMQFFGYLRRDPNSGPDTDYTGYDFWLTKLNQFNGNFANAEMVKAFISSTEYRQRFGP